MKSMVKCFFLAATCFTLCEALSYTVATANTKYLIASFPKLRQVAYTMLPDNVWRPIVIGKVASPEAVAVDSQAQKLYIADPPNYVVWAVGLGSTSNGLLRSVGTPRAVVEGFSAHWLAVDSTGDLYFSGHAKPVNGTSTANTTSTDSVWRLDADQILTGDTFNPTEVYSSANTGEPAAKIYQLGSVAVDDFYIYWGNQAGGKQHGAVCKATRTNVGFSSSQMTIGVIESALDEVRGITTSGTELFWLAPEGVYGKSKSSMTELTDVSEGLLAPPPSSSWSPMSIVWDGNTLVYMSDPGSGNIYTLPASSTLKGNVSHFGIAPGVQGLALLLTVTQSSSSSSQVMGSAASPSGGGAWKALLFAVLAAFARQSSQ